METVRAGGGGVGVGVGCGVWVCGCVCVWGGGVDEFFHEAHFNPLNPGLLRNTI